MTNMARQQLDKIQAWMQSVITHPEGVVAGIQADGSRRHLDVAPAKLDSVILPSQAVSSLDRLAIYARAYYARLLECLQAQFPVLAAALGAELFDEFAFAYLQQHPSRSYTLDNLGRQFAAWLTETRHEAGGDDNAWLDFLADLARLEWNIAEVFDGPGSEGAPPLSIDALLAAPPERWQQARLTPAPALRLVELEFPVDEYYRALRSGEEPAPPERERTLLAVARLDYVVRHHRLRPPQYALLAALIAGQPVVVAIAAGAELVANDEFPAYAENLAIWFRRWAAEGFFTSVELG